MSIWHEVPTLAGRHVTLRPLVREDREALLAASGDGRLWELFYTMVPGLETIDAWLDQAFAEQGYGRAMALAVLDADGRLIGSSRYLRMAPQHRRVEIGATFYAASTQRSAVNTEAKLLMLGHAFEMLGCGSVQIRTDWLNKRSQAAIERLGAKRDGVLRNHLVAADGRVRDMVVYSIIATEWPGVKRALQLRLDRGAA